MYHIELNGRRYRVTATDLARIRAAGHTVAFILIVAA